MKSTAFFTLLLSAILLLSNRLSAADYYWVHPGTATANWSDEANWRIASGDATAHATPPTAADNVFFDANSFTAAGQIVVVDVASVCANMNWTGAANTPTFTIDNPLTIHGDLTFITGMTVNGTGAVTFSGGNPQTIAMAGRSFGGDIVFNKDAGTQAALADPLTGAGNLIFIQGDFLSNDHAIAAANFSFDGADSRNVNLGSSTVTLSGTNFSVTADAAGVLISNAATFNFTNTADAITVDLGSTTGRTFGNFTLAGSVAARTVTLQGDNTHILGTFTLGAYTDFTRVAGTANLTFGDFTAVNNSSLNFNHTGELTFGGTTTLNTTAGTSSLTIANTVTDVFHRGNVAFNDNAVVTYNNSGLVHVRTAVAPSGINLTTGADVQVAFNNGSEVIISGNTDFGLRTVATFNNNGNVDFGDGDVETFRLQGNATLNVTGNVQNVRFYGDVTGNTDNNTTFSFQHTGDLQIDRDITVGNSVTFTVGNNVQDVAIGRDIAFGTGAAFSASNNGTFSINQNTTYNGGGSSFQYNNSGTVTFGGTVAANGITGTLTVAFANSSSTTYNGALTLTVADGGNSITYNFSGGQTANINADFIVKGACDNFVFIGRTGAGSALLNLTATPSTRTWARVDVSNIDASSQANNIRAFAYVDGGGNNGIAFQNNSMAGNRTLYWVAGGPQAGTNTLWSNVNNWSYAPDEFIPAVCLPTVTDSVVFGHHEISFAVANATVDVDGDYAVAGMRWSAVDTDPVNPVLRSVGGATRMLTIAGAFDCYRAVGEITFENEGAANRLNFTFTGARRNGDTPANPVNGWNEIRSGGVNFPREVVFNGNADNTRWRLIDNFSARIEAGATPSNNGSLNLQRGVFDTQQHDLVIGRFNANYNTPRELIISGASLWTIQGRTGNINSGTDVPNNVAMDLRGDNFTFNTPDPASYWYFSGANNDSSAVTEGTGVEIQLGRGADVPREVPSMGIGYRHNDIDLNVDAQTTPFYFRELRLTNTPAPANRQIFIQTNDDNNTQLIFKGLVDFGNNTNVSPNIGVGTVIRGPHAAPDLTWSNISRFEKEVIIGNNSQVAFWGNFQFDGTITVGELSRVWFSRNGGVELNAPEGNRYRFNNDVTLGKASIAYFYANVDWPVGGKTLFIGEDALAYVGDVPSTTVFPTEYGINNWQNIVLGHQGRLVLNNGEGDAGLITENNIIVNLTFGEFSVVELNTEVDVTNGAAANPRTRVTGTMSAGFASNCSNWATLRSVVDGKQADLIVNSAQAVDALVVKDVNVVENVAGIDLTVNAGADAGNNSGASSLIFIGTRAGRNFYWVGGTNKDKTQNPFRKAGDTNYDGVADDNGDNVLWSNPVNWYSEDAALPRRTTLTPAMITIDNQCIPTIIDNVYFLDDSFKGGNNTGNIFQNRRNVLVDLPQAQARDFEWHITAAAFATSGNAGAGFNADCTTCGGPVRFTNEQQPILLTTEMQIAGNLRWVAPGGTLSTGIAVTETVLRNDFTARFSFIGSGTPQSGPGTGPTVHTIASNGQRFAGEVVFDNRYSTWTPIDPMDLNSHRHATSYPIPPTNNVDVLTPWTRASIIINQGALDMGSPAYKAGEPYRINLEGDWTISGLFDYAHFDAATSEVIFDGSSDVTANANNANIIMHENLRFPAPVQPVAKPADDPNGNYNPARRRFYDLIVNKRQNTWDVRVLNSPVTATRHINIQQGRLWDNNEGGSVPMQIKGNLLGTGQFTMAAGTSLFLGSGTANMSRDGGNMNQFNSNPPRNLGTDFPEALNYYPTTFPMGYTRAQITLDAGSTVVYWVRGQQNVSATPVYGNLRLDNPVRGHLEFNDIDLGLVRKRHVINESVTGGVTYDNTTLQHQLNLPVTMSSGTLNVQGNLDLCFNGYTDADDINNGLLGGRVTGGVDLLDHGNQIIISGPATDKTVFVGPGSYLTLGAARDQNLRDAYARAFNLTNVATTFPTGYNQVELHERSFVNYNSGANQTVLGLNGTGNGSYGNLMIANRDGGLPSDVPALTLARKTMDGPVAVRRQLRIYPNAHLIDNGHQMTLTNNGYLYMTSGIPATGGLAAGGRTFNANDLHDLRITWINTPDLSATAVPFKGESRLSLGNATTATTFPADVPNNRVLLQSHTTIVYNAGIEQNICTFTNATDTTQIYANLVLVNPSAGAIAPVNKTAVQETGSGAAAQAADAAGDAENTDALGFQLKGDLIIAPNNSLIDDGYQVRNPHAVDGDGAFRMPVLKATADAITPTGGRATLTGGSNTTGVNGVSRIVLGTAAIATQFPVNFGGTDDAEINFEIAPASGLYGNVVYNSGRRQTIRGLNDNNSGSVRTYANLTLTNPSNVPNGPVPKTSGGSFRVRGTITINPNNNLRLVSGHVITPTVVSSSVPRLHMFSAVATATSATAIAHNDQNIGGAGAVNGPAIFTLGNRDNGGGTFPVFPAYNATHLFLEQGTTIAYGFGSNTSTVATPANQNVQALGNTADAQATYANLWLAAPQTDANRPNEVISKTIVAGTTGFTQNRVRGSLVIAPLANLVDGGIQINGTGGAAQDFRMFATTASTITYMNTAAAHGLASLPASYAATAVFESIAYGTASTLYGASSAPPAASDGASALTLGNATTATLFPTFTGTNGFVDANIQMDADTYVRYNAGVNQTIRGLFGAALTSLNNYANVELVNSAAAGTAVKTLNGDMRIRGNLMAGGRVAGNRFLTTINYASFGQANELATANNNINIQGNWVAFSTGNRNTLNSTFDFSGTANTINNLFTSGTGTVTLEGNGRSQVVASGSIVTGTGSGFTQTVSNRFHNVVIDKGTAGSVNGRTVYLREDPMLIGQTVTFTNGFFWSNADGTQNGGTTNRQDDDNQLTFLNNAGVIQVLGPGTFAGAQGPHDNSYVVGAVRKIGTSATVASAVGGANTFDFPIGHTPFVTGALPDTWLGRGYYYAPSGVLDLTADHDFVGRYYGTNANLAGTTIPAGIRPQDLTNPGAGNHFPTSVKAASLRFINESEFWTIDYSSKVGPATPSGLAFRAKLSWDSNPNRTAVNTSFSSAPLKVAHWTNKGGGLMWYDESRSAALGTEASGRGVQVSVSTTHNGPFNNADDAISILPIELVSFKARALEVEGDGGKVEITWQTAWERDNDYFEVEKSRDGITFQRITRVEPKGNNGFSNSIQHYVHYDEQPWLGKNYYRLKQVDFDGTTTYSKIEVVIFERSALGSTAGNMEVYPNPFAGNSQTLNVVLPLGGVGAGWLVVWDMAGREMYRERIAEGQTQLEIAPEETQGRLARGAYIIRAIGRDKAFTAKVVVE